MIALDDRWLPALEAVISDALSPQHPDARSRGPVQRIADALLGAESPLQALWDHIEGADAQRTAEPRRLGDYFARLALETTDPALRGTLFARSQEQYAVAMALEGNSRELASARPETVSEMK